jgi:hypothetical protein
MLAPIRKIIAYKFFPVCWTVLIIILLCIPGSMVPGKGIFSIPNLDKLVHIILFGTNVLLWGWHYGQSDRTPGVLKQIIVADVVLTTGLGIALEYVQGSGLVSHRSFDVKDIIADTVGALIAGAWLWWRALQKQPG